MLSHIAALNATDEVFAARHEQFFEDLEHDRSSLGYSLLAQMTERLSNEQYSSMKQQLQRKLTNSVSDPISPGIAYFALSVLNKSPKTFEHNRLAYKKILNSALTADFLERFDKKNYNPIDYSAARCIYATHFASDWIDILRMISAIAQSKHPKKSNVFLLDFVANHWNNRTQQVIEYLWDLFDLIVKILGKSTTKLNVDFLFTAVEKTIKLKNNKLSHLALRVLRSVSIASNVHFEIYLPRLYSMLNTIDLDPDVLYPFLTQLVLDFGPVVHFSKAFPNLIEKFTESLSLVSEKRNELYVIGRKGVDSFVNRLDSAVVETPILLHRLIIAILENSPISVSSSSVVKIQMYVCRRLIETPDKITTEDLGLLNALLASCKEDVPSAVSIARNIYFQQSVVNNPEFAPYVRVGRSYCDISVQSRTAAQYSDIQQVAVDTDAGQKSSFTLQLASTNENTTAIEKAAESVTDETKLQNRSKKPEKASTDWIRELCPEIIDALPKEKPVTTANVSNDANESLTTTELPSLVPKPTPTNVANAAKSTSSTSVFKNADGTPKLNSVPVNSVTATKKSAKLSTKTNVGTPVSTTSVQTPTTTKTPIKKPLPPSNTNENQKNNSPNQPDNAVNTTPKTPVVPTLKVEKQQNVTPKTPPRAVVNNDSDDDIQFIEIVKSEKGKKRLPAQIKSGSPPPKKAAIDGDVDCVYTRPSINIPDLMKDLRARPE